MVKRKTRRLRRSGGRKRRKRRTRKRRKRRTRSFRIIGGTSAKAGVQAVRAADRLRKRRTTDPETGAEDWRHDAVFGKNVPLQEKKDVIRQYENTYYDLVGMPDNARRPPGDDGWPHWYNWAAADARIRELEQLITHAVLNKNSQGARWRRAKLPVVRAARKVLRAAVAPIKRGVEKWNAAQVSDNPRGARSRKVF